MFQRFRLKRGALTISRSSVVPISEHKFFKLRAKRKYGVALLWDGDGQVWGKVIAPAKIAEKWNEATV